MKHSTKQDQRPSMQFYPDDWVSEPGLRLCSLEAKGLWIEMICIMFRLEERGKMQISGKKITSKMLAKMLSENEEKINKCLSELKENEVYSTLLNGTIYSRRMVREAHIQKVRAEAGSKGGKVSKIVLLAKKSVSKTQAKKQDISNYERDSYNRDEVSKITKQTLSKTKQTVGVGVGVGVEEGVGVEDLKDKGIYKQEEFEKIYRAYPANRRGIFIDCLLLYKESVKDEAALLKFKKAIINYRRSEEFENKRIKNFNKFMLEWHNWAEIKSWMDEPEDK